MEGKEGRKWAKEGLPLLKLCRQFVYQAYRDKLSDYTEFYTRTIFLTSLFLENPALFISFDQKTLFKHAIS